MQHKSVKQQLLQHRLAQQQLVQYEVVERSILSSEHRIVQYRNRAASKTVTSNSATSHRTNLMQCNIKKSYII